MNASSVRTTNITSVLQNMQPSDEENLSLELKYRSVPVIVVESMIILLINSVAFFGNLMICLAFYRNPRLRIIPNYYVISLAIADLLTSTLCLPLSAGALVTGKWPFSNWLCQLQGYCTFAFSIASLHTMALTACNRYIRVVKIHLYSNFYTSKLTILSVFLIWFWAFLCSALPFTLNISTFVFHAGNAFCYSFPSFTPAFIALFTTTLTVNIPFPMVSVIVLYHKVFRAVRHQGFRVSTARGISTTLQDIKLAKLLFTVTLGFCISWGPVMVVECIRFIGVWKIPRQIYLTSTYFGATSSAINVFIYGVMNRAFRREFVKILLCKDNS